MRDWLFKKGWDRKFESKSGKDHGPDIRVRNDKRHFFILECKGSQHYENDFINALGQICTRMRREPRGINYGIALPSDSAKIAVRRIPKSFAKRNNLNVFSVSDEGKVRRYTPAEMKG